jgi:hypothetical protein
MQHTAYPAKGNIYPLVTSLFRHPRASYSAFAQRMSQNDEPFKKDRKILSSEEKRRIKL